MWSKEGELMMKKNGVKGYAILALLFVLVSVIAFSVPTEKTRAFWITYAFTIVAFVAQIGIWKTALGRYRILKSKFLGLPVLYIGIIYLIVQVLAFVIFLFVPALPTWSAIVICVVIIGFSAICMIFADVARSEIEQVEAKVQEKTSYLKSLQTEIELLAEQENDPAIKAALAQLAEKIHFSDPMSHESLAELEGQISAKVAELEMAINKQEIINELSFLIDKRNKQCKIGK